jgi:Zn-finger nucleic acid-binding protein
MFVGSRFCAACGAGAARERLEDAAPLRCPRCRVDMAMLRLGATVARECSSCGGLWLDPAALQRLSDTSEERTAMVASLTARIPSSAAPADVVRYVPCPCCGKLMNRMNFAQSSGVVLDVCKRDGVWLDRGELQRVLAFVEAGGLAVARDRQRERLAEEHRRLAALQAMGGAGSASQSAVRAQESDSPGGLQRMILDALGVIA